MNKDLLKSEVQNFINESLEANFSKIALLKNPFPEIPWTEILTQIASKAKAKTKLPTWFNTNNIIYPNKISIEQTSSEITANYKANLISGDSIIDLTGGFGIDDYYFSKVFFKVVHCELNKELHEIVKNNFLSLYIENIECQYGDSLEILKNLNSKFDWIYIDPSRRNEAKGKVFMLKDCLPNVPENINLYFTFSNNILIKTAPLLDISAGLSELKNVSEIHVVAINNEVKELLWILKKDFLGSQKIKTINISKDKNEIFDFHLGSNDDLPTFSEPKKYLYEPNSAILKSGGFNNIAIKYNLSKLQQHSHLYTSEELIKFPGRSFKINQTFEYNKANMKESLMNLKANITTRNFPESVEELRKKWKIKDGGELYSFFTTDKTNRKIVLICDKI